ncbi:transglycosylase domain-containing protein [Catellatospora bangladeshensis]|uniref:Transglycosylase n=1 Tax=Catellatospora bangladeshensis TaxID=310355 RepID=A0A8J3JP25_9ACTN|nr:transglycosylase domain-containing protein [Catellatospora bangladeshensis]GIF81334.1 transglycosylase [Catellatospora bangladeshensis]
MRKRDHNLLANAASLLICGLLAGVVVAAAAFPAVAMSGLAAKAAGDAFGKLPDELTVKRSPQISYLYAADGKTPLATMYDENRRELPFEEIPEVVRKAVLAAEDQKFYEHNGVDALGIARAFVANKQAGTVQQGASTLTMQFVRLSISYSADTAQEVVDATEDTTKRKVREMRYAMAIEQRMTKDEILAGYINTAYFGNRAYGIYAASKVYFDKEPKALTAAEAAFLAALVKFPGDYNASTGTGKDIAINRRDYVLQEMVGTGALTQAEADQSKKEELKVVGKVTPNGCVQTGNPSWGFFCDYFQRWWNKQEVFGATAYDRERALKSGGFRIVTTLDPAVQLAMKKNVDKRRKTTDAEALMLAAVEPGTGYVRGLAVNRVFSIDDSKNLLSSDPAKKRKGIKGSRPNTTNPLLTGGDGFTGYQAGSAFKIFSIVAALEKGYPLATTIDAKDKFVTNFPISGKDANCGGYYCAKNASGKGYGPLNMWEAFGKSINTYFVPLAIMAGVQNTVNAAKKMGITFHDEPGTNQDDFYYSNHAEQWGAFVLGVSATTPLELANAYATLVADGKYCEPTPVVSIHDSKGNKLAVGDTRCNQVIKTDVARAATDAARCPGGDRSAYNNCNGTTNQASRGIVGKPIMGKTGTTDDSKSATLTLSTRQLTISGFLTDPDYAHNGGMSHDIVNPAVQYALRDAMKGKPTMQFAKPSKKIAAGEQVSIPNVECKPVAEAKSILKNRGFEVSVAPEEVASKCPKGTVAGTTPSGKTIKGGVVVIQVSNGAGTPGNPPGPGTGGGPGNGGNGGNGNRGFLDWLLPAVFITGRETIGG